MFDRTVPAPFVENLANLCRDRATKAREALGDWQNASALERLETHLRTILFRTQFQPTMSKPFPTAPPGTDVAVQKHTATDRETLVIVDTGLRILFAATVGQTSEVSTRMLDQFGSGNGKVAGGFYADPSDMLVELALDALSRRASKAQRDTDTANAAQALALQQAEEATQNAQRLQLIASKATDSATRLSASNDQLHAELAHSREVIDYLRSLAADMSEDDGTDAAPARDARVSVDEFIHYRTTRKGRTFYVWGPDESGHKKHHPAGATLEEARALRARLHPRFATEAEPGTTPQGGMQPGPSSGSAEPLEVA